MRPNYHICGTCVDVTARHAADLACHTVALGVIGAGAGIPEQGIAIKLSHRLLSLLELEQVDRVIVLGTGCHVGDLPF
ncbi:hypothetical protein D9M71_349890 [compost metagenome]